MKQHITVEQLNELSENARERLREWWKPQEFDLYYDGEINNWENDYDGCVRFDDVKKATANGGTEEPEWIKAYPLLSIGQMIEFLTKNSLQILRQDHEFAETWYIGEYDPFSKNIPRAPYFGELCDALWEAVKEMLEGE